MTNDSLPTEQYNYATFAGTDDFFAFRSALQVGSAAPDGPVYSLNDEAMVPLSHFWQEHDLLIEFGSLT
jgi:hypothetical protein